MPPKVPTTPAEAMRFDPLKAAEELTGKSYKDDEQTDQMGTALHFAHVQNTRRIMEAAGDSHYSIKAVQFQHIIQSNGFELIGEELVESDKCWLHWHAYWRTPGQLLLCEYLDWKGSSGSRAMSVNSGNCHYNWRPKPEIVDDGSVWDMTSSGRFYHQEPSIWIGDHDVREGIITSLNRLAANGEFIEPWVEAGHLWAVVGSLEVPGHYDPNRDYDGITVSRLRRQLPAHTHDLILLDAFEADHKEARARRQGE